MYRQIFASPVGNLTIPIPESWYGQEIEVIAFPVNETFVFSDLQSENGCYKDF